MNTLDRPLVSYFKEASFIMVIELIGVIVVF